MAMEAEGLAERVEGDHEVDRRARTERRGRDRRKPGSRINTEAPSRSLLKVFGAYGVGIMAAILALSLLAGQLLESALPAVAFGVQGGLLGVSILLVALGAIEQRLIEIRLELMMMNGGRRQGDDRRRGDRRGDGSGSPAEPAPAKQA